MLNQKDKEIKEYINKVQDLTIKNKSLIQIQYNKNEFDNEMESIHSREISNLSNLDLYSTKDESNNDIKQKLEFFMLENRKLKDEIRKLQMKLRIEVHENSMFKDNKKNQYKTDISDKDIEIYENKYEELKKKIHELELQLVSKNGKIATLEIQIQSENFPYQRKCKELEELVLAFRNKVCYKI